MDTLISVWPILRIFQKLRHVLPLRSTHPHFLPDEGIRSSSAASCISQILSHVSLWFWNMHFSCPSLLSPGRGGTIIICVTAAPASSNLPPLHIASTFQSTSCILVASLDRSSIYVSMQEGTHHHRTSSSSGSDLGGCFGHLIDPWSQSRHTWSPWVSLAVALCPVTRPPNEQSNHYKHPLSNRRRGGS